MTMAVVAGVKRSHDQIQDIAHTMTGSISRDASLSRRTSRETTAVPADQDTLDIDWTKQRVTDFDRDASIILIGVKGVGKSSLGVLAATAYNRKLVETERAFFDATGLTPPSYRKVHGADAFHARQEAVLEGTLKSYDTGSVIICSFTDLENGGARIIREFARSHPVFHIVRDAVGIQQHLKMWSVQRVKQLLLATGPLLRSCSNFEFFNLTERLVTDGTETTAGLAKSGGLFLTLKRVERDFLKLLRNVLGDHHRVPSHQSAYPLSQVPIHDRSFTMSAQIRVDDIVDHSSDIDDLQVGTDAVELIVVPGLPHTSHDGQPREGELLMIATAFAHLRRSTIVPIILNVTRVDIEEHGLDLYVAYINYCLRLGAEYCTLSLGLDDANFTSLSAGRGHSLIIGSYHFERRPLQGWRDDACLSIYKRSCALDCNIARITMPCSSTEDNFAAQIFLDAALSINSKTRLATYNTGKDGRMSRCFNKVLTPVHPINAIQRSNSAADDAVSAKDVFTALFATFVYEPLHFFIYGANVSYSLSPVMHNAAYKACGMPHRYTKHSSPNLNDFKRLCSEQNFGGAAVVQPYKTGVLPLLAGLSSHAKAIGSVNTILPIRQYAHDGSLPSPAQLLDKANQSGPVKALYGDNTDWIGIRACLRRGLSPANTIRPNSTALVCGAGGQARSTVYALLSLGVRHIFICNRTPRNANTLAQHYNSLIKAGKLEAVGVRDSEQCGVHVLESFSSAWPKEARQPSMIVSSVPTQAADGSPTNFTLPESWLRSPTGGVLVEVSSIICD
jgi:shikimate 5-dehydrogenase